MVITNTGTGDLAVVGIRQQFLPAGTSKTWPWPTTTGGVLIPGPWSIIRTDTSAEIANGTDAIPACVTPASPPRTLTAATGASGQIKLSWASPLSNGGAPISDYIVQRSPTGTSGWVTITDGVNTATTYTVTGLTNGTRYYFRVLAKNVAGNSAVSNTANDAPRTVPRRREHWPRHRRTCRGRSGWRGCAHFERRIGRHRLRHPTIVQRHDGVGDHQRWRARHHGYVVTGLINGSRYYFRVFAHNAAGNGPSSTVVNQIPRTVPGRPACGRPGNARVVLTWTPPSSTGGTAITRYAIQRSTSPTTGWVYLTTTAASTARSFNATGLTNGVRYYFRISAVNAAGIGTYSAYVSGVPTATAGTGYYFPTAPRCNKPGPPRSCAPKPGTAAHSTETTTASPASEARRTGRPHLPGR